jgi:hypothetical protein
MLRRARRWVALVSAGAVVAAGLVAVSPGSLESAHAASGTTIEGTVHADGKSGGVPGVKVELQNYYGWDQYSTTTDASGHYEFDYMNADYPYQLRFDLAGTSLADEGYISQSWEHIDVPMTVGTMISLNWGEDFVADVSLHVGATFSGT